MFERSRPGGKALSSRFLAYYAVTYLSLIGLMGFFVELSARAALIDGVEASLERSAAIAANDLPDDVSESQAWARDVFTASGFRATLIDSTGVVLAESHLDPSGMGSHLDRPEVQAALTGRTGVARRVSASTGFEQLYVALAPTDRGLIVRLSTPVRVIEESLGRLRGSIIVIAVVAGLVGIGAVAWIARRTAKPIIALTKQSLALAAGDLDLPPMRSDIRELDQLGLAISEVAAEQGERLREVREASETLEVVLDALPQGTILLGADDSTIYANPSAWGLLGNVPERLRGIVPLQFQTAIRDARTTGHAVTVEGDHGSPPARLRAVATPFSDDERVLLVISDMTDRDRTDAIRRDFAANASHELKTPVATILAAIEALRIAVERGDPSASGFAAHIEESAHHLDRLVGDLLDLSRLERDLPEMSPVRLDLLAKDEVARRHEKSPERVVGMEADSAVTVRGSHRDLSIALGNLLSNAVRYSDPGDEVSVSVEAEAGWAVVSVSDTGQGIPSRDLERVFERFYRVDSARSRATGGTGLGLAIVKHVAESHGGSVEVESQLGVGSTFRLRLPIADEGSSPESN